VFAASFNEVARLEASQKLKMASILPTLTPLETLRLLAGNAQAENKVEANELVKVTVFLSGATFTGFITGIRDDAGVTYLLLIENDEGRGQSINLVYLPVWAVIAVKVHDAEQILHLLSGGRIAAPQATMNINTLRKKIGDEVNSMRALTQADVRVEVSWDTLTQDDQSLLGLYELIDSFMQTVRQVVVDDQTKRAFKILIGVIRFENAPEAELHQDDRTIIIRAELQKRAAGRFTGDEFRNALVTILEDLDEEDNV